MWSVLFELFFKYDLVYGKGLFLASLFFPLLSFFTLFMSHNSSFKVHRYISLFYIWSSFEISFVLLDFFFKTGQQGWLIQGPLWFVIPSIDYVVRWNFVIDTITLIMFCVVLLVSFLVHFYSLGYMQNDPNKKRFMSYLSLFTFFMLFLVCSGNLIQFFIGWEGVGLCSFFINWVLNHAYCCE